MKKYISILACALLTIAACTPAVNPENETPAYEGNRAKVQLSSSDPLPAEGGTLTAKVSNSPEFTVAVPKTADWLSLNQVDSTLTINVSANNSAVLRYARLSLIDKELNISITSFEVRQAGTDKDVERKSLQVSPATINAKAGDTSATINVAGTADWTASSSNSSFTLSPAAGSGSGTITVSFPANTNPEPVTAVITVATTDETVITKSFEVTITQEGDNSGIPSVKPAAGTVLAEWEFDTPNTEALRSGGIEGVSAEEDNAVGNGGNPYVPALVSGKGKLEYYNGVDKSSVSTKKTKRRIGERGEFVVYCSWTGDYILWSAEADAPLAAGTKLQINFALRPNAEQTLCNWRAEYLDGEEWVNLEDIVLEYHASAAGTAEDPKQINRIIVETATLTKDTPSAQFRFVCTSPMQCSGTEASTFSSKSCLRFAGKFSEATPEQLYLCVPDNPKIVVVE